MLLKVNLANIITIGLIAAIWYVAFRFGDSLLTGRGLAMGAANG